MQELGWDSLVIERGVRPTIDDQTFHSWMHGRPIFVSSVMTNEMKPYRAAVREAIHSLGGQPTMWEEITPRDERPEKAYLDGVDQSDLIVLILGSEYGTRDITGFSPTHKESNRAVERNIPRLLFTRAGLSGFDRDGNLNNWLKELYGELSGNPFSTEVDLTAQLVARLRDIAAGQETPWIKLGALVVAGAIEERGADRSKTFILRTTVRDIQVRRFISQLSDELRQRPERLTFIDTTYPVQVNDVNIQNVSVSSSSVEITCGLSNNWSGLGRRGIGNVFIHNGGNGQPITPADQAEQWSKFSLFGEHEHKANTWESFGLTRPANPTLPKVLAKHDARGSTAEGLARLYVIEGLNSSFNGHLSRLEIGPTTAKSIRIQARFELEGGSHERATIDGQVPLG